MSEWSSRQAHLNEVANYLTEVTDPQTSRAISDELCKINLLWADFAKTAQFVSQPNLNNQNILYKHFQKLKYLKMCTYLHLGQ